MVAPMICLFPVINLHFITLFIPLIIPAAIIGMVVGLVGILRVLFGHSLPRIREIAYNYPHERLDVIYYENTKLLSSATYAIMFLLFGLMNFSAIFANCLFPSYWYIGIPGSYISMLFNLVDAFLSSMVNYCFIICGLTDIGVINTNKKFHIAFYFGFHIILFGYALIVANIWPNGFMFLYEYLCMIGMGVFVLCAIYFVGKDNLKLLIPIGLTVIVALLGFFLLSKTEWFCKHSPWVNNYVLWFLCSDSCMYLISEYYLMTMHLRQIK